MARRGPRLSGEARSGPNAEVGTRSYPLAPMSPLILGMTVLLLPLPAVLWLLVVPPHNRGVALFVLGLYAFVWLYLRPTRFEISASSLEIVWPVRRFSLLISEIETVQQIGGREFRAEHGWGIRIGSGGLWGSFGALKTRKTLFRFYISRLDDFVIIRHRAGRPLLINPAEPEDFVSHLRSLTGSRPGS